MCCLPASALLGGLLVVLFLLSVSAGTVYVQTGSDLSMCTLRCPEALGILELYRICGDEEDPLLEHHCHTWHTENQHATRLHLSLSGCWTLTGAHRMESGVYNVYYYGRAEYLLSSTDVHVLDPIVISNITSKCSRLGEDVAVSLHYSGEESAVTWELDGEPLPERYRLIDGNRTLIIPGVQREEAQRTLRVRVTNPVSEDTRDYRLINDPNILTLLEEGEDLFQRRSLRFGVVAAVVLLMLILAVRSFCIVRLKCVNILKQQIPGDQKLSRRESLQQWPPHQKKESLETYPEVCVSSKGGIAPVVGYQCPGQGKYGAPCLMDQQYTSQFTEENTNHVLNVGSTFPNACRSLGTWITRIHHHMHTTVSTPSTL